MMMIIVVVMMTMIMVSVHLYSAEKLYAYHVGRGILINFKKKVKKTA